MIFVQLNQELSYICKIKNYIMKKIVSLFAMFFLCISIFAQKDLTKFLGIPVDGSKTQMRQKLFAKGYTLK